MTNPHIDFVKITEEYDPEQYCPDPSDCGLHATFAIYLDGDDPTFFGFTCSYHLPMTVCRALIAQRDLRCPGCGERAIHNPPLAKPWLYRPLDRPQWSHEDGEPLCPVSDPAPGGGVMPAEPVPARNLINR